MVKKTIRSLLGGPGRTYDAPISGEEWADALLDDPALGEQMVERIRAGQHSPWGKALRTRIQELKLGSAVELGAGTGEISLGLASDGLQIGCVDFEPRCLQFISKAASALGVEVALTEADITKPLALPDDSTDCVWSSGVLEHFDFDTQVAVLEESARVARKAVITLVPNARSIAYRLGKHVQEREGTWPYGREIPIDSLRPHYEAAGLTVDAEFSVGALHALHFLPDGSPLREEFSAWAEQLGEQELLDLGQGYLLVTVGRPQKRAVRS